MTSSQHLKTLADAERLPQGLPHWLIGVQNLYVYGGLLKRIVDQTSTVPLGGVDVIALDMITGEDIADYATTHAVYIQD